MSNGADEQKTSAVFVSYSRRDTEIADRLVGALEAAGRDVWQDKGDIPDLAEWKQEIREGIEKSDAVIFLLSPDFCSSAECRAELDQALEKGKRLVPVRACEVDYAEVAPSLASINWIDLAGAPSFDEGVDNILRALDADLGWAKLHTAVTRRLAQYEQRGGDASLLLRGRQLSELEAAFAEAAGKEPHPTDAQRRFLAESRRATNRRQRIAIGALGAGLMISIALGTLAYFQRNAAREARDEARARYYASQIRLARTQADAEPDLAFATLRDTAQTAGALREFTWNMLADRVARKIFTVGDAVDTTRSEEPAFAMALSADGGQLAIAGKRMALAGQEGRAISDIHVWDIDTGALMARVEVSALRTRSLDVIGSLALSHDGALLAAVQSGTVDVWEVASGTRIMSQDVDATGEAVRFPPVAPVAGEVPALVLIGMGKVRLWPRIGDEPQQIRALDFIDAFEFRDDGRVLRLLGRKNVYALDFADRRVLPEGDEQKLAPWASNISALPYRLLGRGHGTIEIIERDRETGAWTGAAVLRGAHSSSTVKTRLSADGRWAVTAGGDNKVVVWDLSARRKALVLDGLRGVAKELAISRDGKRIVAIDENGALIVWEAEDGIVRPGIRRDRRNSTRCLGVTADGQVLSVSDGVAVLSTAHGSPRTLEVGGTIGACALSPSGGHAALTPEAGGMLLWQTASGSTSMLEGSEGATGLAFSPDEAILAHWEGGLLALRDLPSGRMRAHLGKSGGIGWDIQFLDKGRLVARKTADDGEVALVVDAEAGTILRRIALPERPKNLATCGDRNRMAAIFGHEAVVYNLADGSAGPRFAWTAEPDFGSPMLAPQAVAFNPDCTSLAIGDDSGRLAVWRVADPAALLDIPAHSGMTVVTHSFGGGSTQAGHQTRPIGRGVKAVAISPDERTIATGGGTESGVGELRLWDAASGLLLAELPAGAGLVTGLAFSQDGTRLTVVMDPDPNALSGRIVEVWDARARLPFAVTLAHAAPVAHLRRTADGMIESMSADPAEALRLWHLGPAGLVAIDTPLRNMLAASLPDWLRPAETTAPPDPMAMFVSDGWVDVKAPGWAEPVRVPNTGDWPSIFEALAAVHTADGVLTLQVLGAQSDGNAHGLIARSLREGVLPKLIEVHEPMLVARDLVEIPGTNLFALAGSSATPNDATGVLRIWDSATLAPVASFVGHQRRLSALLLIPEAAIILVGDEAGMIHAWPISRLYPRTSERHRHVNCRDPCER